MTVKTCEQCKGEFKIKDSDARRGRGRFCSKSCAATGVNGSSFKHGDSAGGQTKEYRTWVGIRRRTTSESAQNSKYYLGRGITVCARWQNFENFLEDMGRAPSPDHSIDRIDNDGNYEPENCCWATRAEQMSNTRLTVHLEYDGQNLTQEEWGRKTGLGGTTICKRLKRGWTVEQALTLPMGTFITR